MKDIAITTSSGGFKGVFIHGVLSLFEKENFLAEAYASCSSSALVAASAVIKKISTISISIWNEANEITKIEGNSMSNAQLVGIKKLLPALETDLFNSSRRFLVSTSFVKTKEAAVETQSEKSRRLGQKLLIEAARNITTWRDNNLEHHLFDTFKDNRTRQITRENLKDVLYATTRMMHAWHIPANINGEPYIDGSYTSICPVIPTAELGYKRIICITTEHDKTKFDLFSDKYIPERIDNTEITFIKPDYNLADIGVDFTKASVTGLEKAFQHGVEKAKDLLNNN
jgi:predicted patatin/cPLA2 family phospholipase